MFLPKCQILIWKTAMVTCSKLMQTITKSTKKNQMSATDQKAERGSFTIAVRCTSIQTTR